jgi:cytochrome oxidase Cu insertion factor (SCO1/SenC/PrrC family)
MARMIFIVLLSISAISAAALIHRSVSALQAQKPTPPSTQLKVGDPAPDFTLTDQNGKQVKLSDFKGKKNVVLAFYVLAFTGG